MPKNCSQPRFTNSIRPGGVVHPDQQRRAVRHDLEALLALVRQGRLGLRTGPRAPRGIRKRDHDGVGERKNDGGGDRRDVERLRIEPDVDRDGSDDCNEAVAPAGDDRADEDRRKKRYERVLRPPERIEQQAQRRGRQQGHARQDPWRPARKARAHGAKVIRRGQDGVGHLGIWAGVTLRRSCRVDRGILAAKRGRPSTGSVGLVRWPARDVAAR